MDNKNESIVTIASQLVRLSNKFWALTRFKPKQEEISFLLCGKDYQLMFIPLMQMCCMSATHHKNIPIFTMRFYKFITQNWTLLLVDASVKASGCTL